MCTSVDLVLQLGDQIDLSRAEKRLEFGFPSQSERNGKEKHGSGSVWEVEDRTNGMQKSAGRDND